MMKTIALITVAATGVLLLSGCETTGYYGYGVDYPDYWGYANPYPYGFYAPYGYYRPYGYYGPYRHHGHDWDDWHGHWRGDDHHFQPRHLDHRPEFRGGPIGKGLAERGHFDRGHLGGEHLGHGPIGGGHFGGPLGGGHGGHR